jgi:SEC-C motif-containing protein
MAGRCPCGTGLTYDECCEPFHVGEAAAPTAEALMRSRFSAFARADEAYLLRTWHWSGRPQRIEFDDGRRWTRLDVLGHTDGGLLDSQGTVQFEAHYRQDGKPGVQRENSRFTRENGEWLYVAAI